MGRNSPTVTVASSTAATDRIKAEMKQFVQLASRHQGTMHLYVKRHIWALSKPC